MRFSVIFNILTLSVFLQAKENFSKRKFVSTRFHDWKILKTLPRINKYYTQGIIFESGFLFGSVGLYGESVLVKKNFTSLKDEIYFNLRNKFFGESIGLCHNNIYQLTWKEKTIIEYSYTDLIKIKEIPMDNRLESGWGLANYSKDTLLATDGSSNIYLLNCTNNLIVQKIYPVTLEGKPLNKINALVFVDGFVYANVYGDPKIYKINLESKPYATVVKIYDFEILVIKEIEKNTLTRERYENGDVFNGIAYNPDDKTFIITGKSWGYFYVVKLN